MSTDTPTTPDASPQSVPVVDLLRPHDDLVFCGLNDTYDESLPAALSEGPWNSSDPITLKAALKRLPKATSTSLKTVNPFVENGEIDVDAIRNVEGLDVASIEQATDCDLDAIAAETAADAEIDVRSHKDIVDPRRLALATLGFNTKFRWQIASNSYAIINPQDALFPALSALQKRGETGVFGRLMYDDFGGIVDIYMVFPSVGQELSLGDLKRVEDSTQTDIPDWFTRLANVPTACPTCDAETVIDEATDTIQCTSCSYETSGHMPAVTLMHGLRTGYSMRGDRAFFAEPIVFIPERNTVLPGIGEKRRRRHSGLPTDSSHERANGRTPMHEWFGNAYDTAKARSTRVDAEVIRSRAISMDFDELPFDIQEFYECSGIPTTYASDAAERAGRLAAKENEPTLWALHISLLMALRDGWSGNNISKDLDGYRALAQELIQQPAYAVQVALREYELQAAEEGEDDAVLPEHQQLLSDSLEDLAPLDAVKTGSEAHLNDPEAQAVETTLQQTLDAISPA